MSVEVEKVIDENGTIRWFKKGTEIFHKEDGPAIELTNGSRFWYQNGKRHRLDGPAREYNSGHKYWYIEGIRYSEEEFNKTVEKLNQQKECSDKIIEIDGKKYKLIPID